MERSVVTKLVLNPAGFIGGLKAASGATRGFMSEFDQAAQKNTKGFHQLAQGAAIGGVAILGALGMAAKAAMNFDKAMSGVASNGTEFTKNMGALREAALQAGAATQFSATQAADAENELAKAGVSVKDILGGGLKGALDLAAAGQLDVGDAAEIAATAMTQFGLAGSKVPHIADLLSATANKAQGSVKDVGMALKQGGLVASQFGLSIEETTGSLAAFAKAGLIGSDAGTSLKTMLLALANPSKESAALMEKLGIHAYDATGKFVGLAGLAGNLRQALSGLTQQQRDQALAQIFGADATRAANVLYRNGAEGIKKWTSQVDDAGNAARTAATKTDNLAGDLERLGGSFETALIKQGSGATGALRGLTQAGTHAIDTFSNLPAPVQSTVTWLALAAGGALTVAGAYGVMAPKVREARTALESMGPAGQKANVALGKVGKAAGVATVAIVGLEVGVAVGNALSEAFGKAAPSVDKLTTSMLELYKTGKTSGAAADAKAFAENLDLITDKSSAVTNFGRRWSDLDQKIGETVGYTGQLAGPFDDANRSVAAMDAALADLVRGGHADAAKQQFGALAAAAAAHGTSIGVLNSKLPEYNNAVHKASVENAGTAESMGTLAGQARTLSGGLQAAAHEAGSLKEVLSGLNDVNISSAEAGINWQSSINGLTGALKENHRAWNGNSTAALANRQAVIDRIKVGQDFLGKHFEETKATRGEAVAVAEATSKHAAMRAQIINSAVAAGLNRVAVTAMVDALFKIPRNTQAKVSAPGAAEAKAKADAFRQAAERIKDRYVATIEAHGTSAAAASINNAKRAAEAMERTYTINVVTRRSTLTLGPAAGGGGSRIDKSRWGNVYSFAGGGIQAKVARPGTLVQWAEPETGGEAYIPRRGNPGRSKAILAEAASWYGGMVSYARGGAHWAGGSGRGGDTHIHFAPTFTGPVGSQMQLRSWLAGAIDDLKRRGRVS